MIRLLIKAFINDSEDITNTRVREKYGVLSGIIGIICNIILFSTKLIIGILINSIAVITDAFNNLSDCASSTITIVGAKMSNRSPDREHPFGHGRFEYISALIVSFIIMFVGAQLFMTSLNKVISPEPVNFKLPLLILLIFSVFIKVWMYSYNKYIGKKIKSGVNFATAADSLNDVIATSAVILSIAVGYLLNIKIDGYIGIAVSVMVIFSGFKISKDVVSVLLGKPPEKEVVEALSEALLKDENIIGIHDLIIHDYGPGRIIASVHAEVSDEINIVKIHEVIDKTEHDIKSKLGIEIVIHMDPISVNSPETNQLKQMVIGIITAIDSSITIHDFRITNGENNINLIFDMVVPCEMKPQKRKIIIESFEQELKAADSRFNAVINIDNGYTS